MRRIFPEDSAPPEMIDEKTNDSNDGRPQHYYGDIERRLFLLGSSAIALAFPLFQKYLNVPAIITIILMVILLLGAGLMKPRNAQVISANAILAGIYFMLFEYTAISLYPSTNSPEELSLYWICQLLALLFFAAAYFGIKTWRGFLQKSEHSKQSHPPTS